MLRPAFQGTSFCLSDTRTQRRGQKHPRSSLQGLALSPTRPALPYQLSPVPRPNQEQRCVRTRGAQAHEPLPGPSLQLLCDWMERVGRPENTQPPPPNRPAPGRHRDPSRRSREAKPQFAASGTVGTARAVATQWAPLFLPQRGGERARGRRHNGAAPTPAPCAKALSHPLPCASAGSQLSSPGCSRLNRLLYVLLTFI